MKRQYQRLHKQHVLGDPPPQHHEAEEQNRIQDSFCDTSPRRCGLQILLEASDWGIRKGLNHASFTIAIFSKRLLKKLNYRVNAFCVTLQHRQELGKSLCFLFVQLVVFRQ